MAQAREALAVADDQLRYSRIIAPIDGTVIQRSIRVGETVVPGTMATLDEKSLMVVADMSTLIAKVELNQIDVAKVRLDRDVTLTLDALPGKNYHAKVSKIAPAAITPKGKGNRHLSRRGNAGCGALADIKPGMTADVKFHIDVRKGVLKLPIEAVTKEDGKHFVSKLVENSQGRPKSPTRSKSKSGFAMIANRRSFQGRRVGRSCDPSAVRGCQRVQIRSRGSAPAWRDTRAFRFFDFLFRFAHSKQEPVRCG